MSRRAIVTVTLLAACGAGEPPGRILHVDLDYPPSGTPGDPWPALDQLRLSVARSGETDPLIEVTFAVGEAAALPDVPFGVGLVTHLVGEENGLERAYGRTCAIDVGPDSEDGVHLYFARQRSWGEVEGPATGVPAYAIGMADGGALFGGDGGTLDRFDPIATGSFDPVAGALIPRGGGALVRIADRALLLGGESGERMVEAVELLRPEPEVQPGVSFARTHLAAVTLADGRVLVTGGEAADGPVRIATADARLLVLEGDSVTENPAGNPSGLTQARAGHTLTRLGSEIGAEVLVVGGWDHAGGFASTVELYQPFENAFVRLPGAVERFGHVAALVPGGRVLIVGGYRPDGAGGQIPATDFLLYDPVLGSFSSGGSMPLVDLDDGGDGVCGSPEGAEDDVCGTQFGVVDVAAVPLPDGNVLIMGGRRAVDSDGDLLPDALGDRVATTYVATIEEVGGAFVAATTSSMAAPRAGHTAVPLCDGSVLVVGGADAGAPVAERYNPRSDIRR